MNKIVSIFILVGCCMTVLSAQKGWEVGGYIGFGNYFGDLNTEFRLDKPRPAFGLIGRRNFNTRVSTSLSLNYTRVTATDQDSGNSFEQMRNLNFFGNVFDLNAHIEFNFFNYVHGTRDEWFTPYIFAGFGVLKFNPKRKLNGTTYSLKEFGTEGQSLGSEYGGISASYVAGIGMKWDINVDWSFNLHLRASRVLSDHFDDVSLTYPNQSILQQRGAIAVQLSDPSGIDGFATEGRQRGDSNNRDYYVVIGIGIMKYFGYLPCPKLSDH